MQTAVSIIYSSTHSYLMNVNIPAKPNHLTRGNRGTRQEWLEGPDTSLYYTMDYANVQRRRPIHNKALPLGP